jgi:hypothetical protein
MLFLPSRVRSQEKSTSEGGAMPRDDTKLQKEMAEIRARLDRYERTTHWILTLVAVLAVLALFFQAGLLLELRASL